MVYVYIRSLSVPLSLSLLRVLPSTIVGINRPPPLSRSRTRDRVRERERSKSNSREIDPRRISRGRQTREYRLLFYYWNLARIFFWGRTLIFINQRRWFRKLEIQRMTEFAGLVDLVGIVYFRRGEFSVKISDLLFFDPLRIEKSCSSIFVCRTEIAWSFHNNPGSFTVKILSGRRDGCCSDANRFL